MKLYLVIGENHMPIGDKDAWGVCGLFKNHGRAWTCPITGFEYRKVIELETDLLLLSDEERNAIDDYETQLRKPYSRMIRLEAD